MKLLITGSKGQLGNELLTILKNGRAEIGAIHEAYKGAEVIGVDVDELDITDTAAVYAMVQKERPDVILNCAAMTNVDGCETMLETAMKVNAIGPRNLAAAATAVGAKLIHVSTDYVFAGNGTSPYCEWEPCAPNTVYGKSKRLGEEYVLAQCPRSFVVRTAWLYGYVGHNFVKTMRKLGAERERLTVVCDQRGNPTSANDLAYHMLKLVLTDEYGVYHCTNEGECSWYDFACRIMEKSGLSCEVAPCTTAEYPSKTPRPAYSSLQNLSLACTVGNEMRPWEEALDMYLENLGGMDQ
ncbi:MAG: dTDP-4-dehydrorhamnose reductase [Clostridia bacterium]|nr:dTDP-4-dehydrorhamnose reductase [Clostridia bacterium]